MKIGDRIKQKRVELGYSVESLAEMIGKNKATVYRYENNEIENFPSSTLKKLAEALKVTPRFLLGFEWESIDLEIIERIMENTFEKKEMTWRRFNSIQNNEVSYYRIDLSSAVESLYGITPLKKFYDTFDGFITIFKNKFYVVAQSKDDIREKDVIRMFIVIPPIHKEKRAEKIHEITLENEIKDLFISLKENKEMSEKINTVNDILNDLKA